MSIYYYPKPISETEIPENPTSIDLEKATDNSFEFATVDINDISSYFQMDDLEGNLPQVISSALEESLIDVEDESTEEEYTEIIELLNKIGNETGSSTSDENLEFYLGYLTNAEVLRLEGFFNSFNFESDEVEQLKLDLLTILKEIGATGKGLIYTYA